MSSSCNHNHDLAPGVSDLIDQAIRNNNIPFAQSSRLCKICFDLLDISCVTSSDLMCKRCSRPSITGLKRRREDVQEV